MARAIVVLSVGWEAGPGWSRMWLRMFPNWASQGDLWWPLHHKFKAIQLSSESHSSFPLFSFLCFLNRAARFSSLLCLCFLSPWWLLHSGNRKDILPNPSKAASLTEKHSISRCSTAMSAKQIKAEVCSFCTTDFTTSFPNCSSETVLQPRSHLSLFGHSVRPSPGAFGLL